MTFELLSVLQCMQHISLSKQHYFHYKLNVYELVYYLACGPSALNTLKFLNPVFRRELFGILLNVLERPQTLSLLDTVNELNFPAFIGR